MKENRTKNQGRIDVKKDGHGGGGKNTSTEEINNGEELTEGRRNEGREKRYTVG